MAARPHVYVDTNVFILLAETAGEVQGLLVELLGIVRQSEMPFLVTSELTSAELLVKPYRDRRADLVDTYRDWIQPSNWLDAVPVHRDVLVFAARLRSQYRSLKLPDAIHISTALRRQCTHVLTDDGGLNGPYRVDHSPYSIPAMSRELEIIRPEPSTLQNLLAELSRS